MDSFYGHSVYNNFITVEWYMYSYDKLRNLSQSSLNSNVLSCFFLCERGCVCVDVLGCVIVPVRNFKTIHYPHYPLPCEYRNDALSDISHLKHSLLRSFKILDSAVKVVMNTTHVTVPFVFFSISTPGSSALSPNMAYGSTVVTFLCKEIKTFVIIAVKTT